MMKNLISPAILSLAIASSCSVALAREATDKPNIVIFYLDDAGYGDFSHNGNPTIETPSITKLAQEGTNFSQFYVTSPACSVSRYSLLTGKYPQRSGLGSWVIGPHAKKHLHVKEKTLAEVMKDHGYATAMFGKWHLGNANKQNNFSKDAFPPAHGFDEWTGTNVSHDYRISKLIEFDGKGNDPIAGYTTLAKNLPSDIKASESLVGLYTEKAVSFIDRNKEKPFFLYIPHNQPHLGVFASDKYKGVSRRGILGDAMAEVDDSVKNVRLAIEKAGLTKNTIVIFASDNGPWVRFKNATKSRYGEARMHVGYALPFKDGKGSNWEGGHRVPGIITWPGQINANTVNVKPISTLDLLPTLCKLTGATLPQTTLDGRDITSYLSGDQKQIAEIPFALAYSGGKNEINAYRSGKWKIHTKLISQLGTKHGFKASEKAPLLFQVEQDLSENFNRAKQHPEIVTKLKAELDALRKRIKKEGSYWDVKTDLK